MKIHPTEAAAFAVAIGIAASVFCTPAAAADCKPLARVTQVKMKIEDHGDRPLIPVAVNGQKRWMLLDTGGFMNFITPETVTALKMPTKAAPIEIIDAAGEVASDASGKDETLLSHLAGADTLEIGRMRWRGVDFFISRRGGPAGVEESHAISGAIGPQMLKDYDLDLDFGSNTMSVMSSDHCPGRVIYWKAPAVAVLEAWLYNVWHLNVPVKVDGKSFNAILDTGASRTTMMTDRAERELDIEPGSPDTPKVGNLAGRAGAAMYKHRFKQLSFNGIAVSNPEIVLMPDLMTRRMAHGPALGSHLSNQDPRNFPDLLIGMDILRHFHMYIAYKESKVYITPASAPAAPAPAAASH